MLRIVAAMTLMSPILDAPQPDQLTLDPLGWAAHQSALCKCPDPLVNYLTYRMPMQLDGQPLAPRREGGREHLAIMQLVNERWGPRYDIAGYGDGLPDPDYVNEWHDWIEQVQAIHVLDPVYVQRPAPTTPDKDVRPAVNRAPPVNTTIKLVCDECAGASCDANRLALRAIQAIHDGSYSDDCANGCVNAENEMHSRVIDMIWDVGPTSGGFTFKIEAKQAEFELQLVHAKLTPIWGDQFQVVIPGLNIQVPVLSWLHGYRIHILSPDGQWSSTAADLNQPRPYLSPPWVPYPSCHPAGSSSGTGSGNGYVGNNDTGSNHGGGCIVSLPRPLP